MAWAIWSHKNHSNFVSCVLQSHVLCSGILARHPPLLVRNEGHVLSMKLDGPLKLLWGIQIKANAMWHLETPFHVFQDIWDVLAMREHKQPVVKLPDRKRNSYLQPNKLAVSTKWGRGAAISPTVSPASSWVTWGKDE